MRSCPRCGTEHELKGSYCSDCRRAYLKEWKRKNPDYMRDYKRRTYQARGLVRLGCRNCGVSFEGRRGRRYCDTCREGGRLQTFRAYGLSQMEWQEMMDRQLWRCAICRLPSENWHIDHDHETGRVRQVLCPTCNWGLGNFKDDPELLRTAAAYVAFHDSLQATFLSPSPANSDRVFSPGVPASPRSVNREESALPDPR